jgi:hypothetical protein
MAEQSGAKAKIEHEFLMAADRCDLVDESFADASPRELESLVASLVVAVERAGSKYWAKYTPAN